MTDDPMRLLDENGSALVRSLLSAAREEQPDHAALRRTLTAVAAGASVVSVGASASASAAGGGGMLGSASLGSANSAASSTLLVVVKWLGVGALAGALSTSAGYSVSQARTPPAQAVAPSVAKAVQAPKAPRPLIRDPAPEAAEIPAPRAIVPAPPVTGVEAPRPESSSASESATLPAAESAASLAAEVASLDGVRRVLSAGDAARALNLLDGYETRFPGARMLPEALYLQLEAFTQLGDRAGADGVARRILRVRPSSPHAARARAVLGLNK